MPIDNEAIAHTLVKMDFMDTDVDEGDGKLDNGYKYFYIKFIFACFVLSMSRSECINCIHIFHQYNV